MHYNLPHCYDSKICMLAVQVNLLSRTSTACEKRPNEFKYKDHTQLFI